MDEQVFQKLSDHARLSQSPLLVFAADPDCGGGLRCFGVRADGTARTRADFLELCRQIAADGAVDGVLLSPYSAEVLCTEPGFSADWPAQPMVRFNAESAVWTPRHAHYRKTFSQPFTTVTLDNETFHGKVKLGLYSITLNNDADSDWLSLAAYLDFAQAVAHSTRWSHFLEVFPPQIEAQNAAMSLEATGEFLADSIVRLLSHLPRRERPLFLKTTFTTPKIWRELCDFDPKIVIGALGGARMGTLETLQLAQNVVHNGGRAILFGRAIFEDPNPRLLCQLLRQILDQKLDADAAFELYQKEN